MWLVLSNIIILIHLFSEVLSYIDTSTYTRKRSVIPLETFARWDNATVPFYVDSEHYDHEQTTQILTALSMFSFRTCIKFMPVMSKPAGEEVLVFQNPHGIKRCVIDPTGHSIYESHRVTLGYDCLRPPHIDMMVMKALGFTFEHNRDDRDSYVEVLPENIEPGATELFTKENVLPIELRSLPYDVNSVMHFDTRGYSRNGHRTIIIRDHNFVQNRVGLTATDLRKIKIVYGPLCRARDRQEKIELCQSYPGVARKKRDTDEVRKKRNTDEPTEPNKDTKPRNIEEEFANKSLRVNPDITSPPDTPQEVNVMDSLKDLDIDNEIEQIIDNVYKISAAALKKSREKHCLKNDSQTNIPTEFIKVTNGPNSDVLDIIEVVANYASGVVDDALKNLTKLCEEPENLEVYQRASCNWKIDDPRCWGRYKSTKSGNVKYSTQHRPVYYMSTKNVGNPYRPKQYGRSSTDAEGIPLTVFRRKRELSTETNDADRAEEIDQEKSEDHADKEDIAKEIVIEDSYNRRSNRGKKRAFYDSYEEERSSSNKYNLKREKERPRKLIRKESLHTNEDTKYKRPRKEKKLTKYRDELQYSRDDKIVRLRSEEEKRPKKVIESREYTDVEENKDSKTIINERENTEKEEEPQDKPFNNRERRPNTDRNKKFIPKDSYYSEHNNVEVRPKKSRILKDKDQHRKSPRIVALSKENREFYGERKWPGGVVPYIIQENTAYDTQDMRRRIQEVNDLLQRETCVKLVEIAPRQASKYQDYIVIDTSPDYVTGRVGGRQQFGSIELYRGGQHRQHAAMMAMAMLGFYFELSRHDRDDYVRVHLRHVRPDKLHHFEKIRSDATLPLPYDYRSATHPAWQFWRQLGRTGISTVATYKEQDSDGKIMKSLGQNKKLLSDIDIVKINSVYGIKCFEKSHAMDKSETLANESAVLSDDE